MTCASCDRVIEAYPCECGYGQEVSSYRPAMPARYAPMPFGVTKEEFGLTLYEVIKLIGGILGLDEQRSLAINAHQGYKVQAILARRKEHQHTLAQQLPRLNNSEMAQILLRYPWVVQA